MHWLVLENFPITCTKESGVHGVSYHACRKVTALKSFVFSSSTRSTCSLSVEVRVGRSGCGYLLRQLMAALGSVEAFVYSFNEIALNGPSVLLTLHDSVYILQWVHGLRTFVIGACVAANSASANSLASMSSPKSSSSSSRLITGGPVALAAPALA